MANLYIFAGQVAHTYKELSRITGTSYFGAKTMVARWNKSMKDHGVPTPLWFYYFKIDDKTTDVYIEKIRTETYERYTNKCEVHGHENKFDPPQGKVEWEYTPSRKLVPIEDQKDGGGCKHRLWNGDKCYYQTHDLDDWRRDTLVYQNHDPERVNREHRRRCHEEGLWHPWRKGTSYIIDGRQYTTMTMAAAAIGISYWTFRRKIKACRTRECNWPEGWEQVWE